MKFEEIIKLMEKRRSIRQFKQTPISREIIEKCVNVARLAPSAKNLQPLEFLYIDDPQIVKDIFPNTRWAGYINPDGNPKEDCEPVSYLLNLVNLEICDNNFKYGLGAAVENFIMSTLANGIGTCWLLSINRKNIKNIVNLPEKYDLDSMIALGYPNEDPIYEDTDEDIKYYKDENSGLHVPKRKMSKIYHHNKINSQD